MKGIAQIERFLVLGSSAVRRYGSLKTEKDLSKSAFRLAVAQRHFDRDIASSSPHSACLSARIRITRKMLWSLSSPRGIGMSRFQIRCAICGAHIATVAYLGRLSVRSSPSRVFPRVNDSPHHGWRSSCPRLYGWPSSAPPYSSCYVP
jgi:hypothetical protein